MFKPLGGSQVPICWNKSAVGKQCFFTRLYLCSTVRPTTRGEIGAPDTPPTPRPPLPAPTPSTAHSDNNHLGCRLLFVQSESHQHHCFNADDGGGASLSRNYKYYTRLDIYHPMSGWLPAKGGSASSSSFLRPQEFAQNVSETQHYFKLQQSSES